MKPLWFIGGMAAICAMIVGIGAVAAYQGADTAPSVGSAKTCGCSMAAADAGQDKAAGGCGAAGCTAGCSECQGQCGGGCSGGCSK